MADRGSMRVTATNLPWIQLTYVKKNGSDAAHVKQLMRQMDYETNIMRNQDAIVNDAESFPNKVANSERDMVLKLLDIV